MSSAKNETEQPGNPPPAPMFGIKIVKGEGVPDSIVHLTIRTIVIVAGTILTAGTFLGFFYHSQSRDISSLNDKVSNAMDKIKSLEEEKNDKQKSNEVEFFYSIQKDSCPKVKPRIEFLKSILDQRKDQCIKIQIIN